MQRFGGKVVLITGWPVRPRRNGRASCRSTAGDAPTRSRPSWPCLLSDEASYVNGQDFGIDGGLVGAHTYRAEA